MRPICIVILFFSPGTVFYYHPTLSDGLDIHLKCICCLTNNLNFIIWLKMDC